METVLQETVTKFLDDGYAVMSRYCGDADIARLKAAANRLIADRTGGAGKIPSLLWIRAQANELLLFDPCLLERTRALSEQYFAAPCEDLGVRLFVKPALVGAAVPWHQDEAYSDPAIDQPQLNVWIPLQNVTEESGCLRVAPRSHLGSLVPHRKAAMPLTLEIDCDPPVDTKSLEIECGDAALLDRRILHASFPNRSSNERIAMVLICRGEPKRRNHPIEAPWLDSLKAFANMNTNLALSGPAK